jgi:hypothetical protein
MHPWNFKALIHTYIHIYFEGCLAIFVAYTTGPPAHLTHGFLTGSQTGFTYL